MNQSEKLYRINEIFYSLQGEGFWVGTPMVFVRFAGCNRKCNFCDTDFSCKQELTLAELLTIIVSLPAQRVCFTGGEPALQLTMPLLSAIWGVGKKIHIETNGEIDIPLLKSGVIDWVTVSPKGPDWKVKFGDELKVVYQGQDLHQYDAGYFYHYFLQPCSEQNIQQTIDKVKEETKWRLSLQTQKMISIR